MGLVERLRRRFAPAERGFEVEVAYARPDRQIILACRARPGMRLIDVIERSGILEMFPEIDLPAARVGVFGQLRSPQTPAAPGDRIQIYRPLRVDPKERRRLVARTRRGS